MIKRIRASNRGLTFTLNESDIKVGAKYRYIVDKANNEIVIIPDAENGNLKVSKKKAGTKIKPLFDIRSKEVKSLVSTADYLEVSIVNGQIVVSVYKKKKSLLRLIKGGKCRIDEVLGVKAGEIILPYAKAAGDDSYQYSIYEWMQTISETVIFKDAEEVSAGIKATYDVVSMFSGAGMFDKAFLDTGRFRFLYAVDSDEAVKATYEHNIGEHMHCKDIRDVKGLELPKAELFIASPCCQAFSNANRHNMDTAEAEEKRLLVEEVVRLANETECPPEVIVVENVPQMVTKEKGIYISKLLDGLPDYKATVKIVTDYKVGGFTERQRCIVILSRIGEISLPDIEIIPSKTVKDALKNVDASWYNFDDYSKAKEATARKMQFVPPGGNWRDIPKEVFAYGPQTHSDVMRRLSWDEVAPTITNVRKNNIMPPEGNRCLSIAEAAALMGLSKDFKFIGKLSAMQQMLGNGVTQAIGKLVANAVINSLDSNRTAAILT